MSSNPSLNRTAAGGLYLKTHCIPMKELYANHFSGFLQARQKVLLGLVTRNTGHAAPNAAGAAEEGDGIPTAVAHDSGMEVVEVD